MKQYNHSSRDLALWSDIFEYAPTAIIVADQSLHISHINGKASHLFASDKKTILGLPLSTFFPKIGKKEFLSLLQSMKHSQIYETESLLIISSQRSIPVHLRIQHLNRAAATTFVIHIEEQPEKKRQEEEYHLDSTQIRALMNAMPDSIYFKDRECRLTRISQKLVKDLGFTSADEIIGKTDIDLFGPEFGNFTMKIDREIIETGKPKINLVEERKLTNGDSHWTFTSKAPVYNDTGEIIGLVGISREINDLKKIEAELRVKENQLAVATQVAQLGYWEYDPSEQLFTFNDAFYAIFKTTAEEVGGYRMSPERYAELFLFPEDSEIVAREFQRAREKAGLEYHRTLEHRIKYADGEAGFIAVRFFALINESGEIYRTIGINQDITERKLTELALRDNEITMQKAFEAAALGPCKYNFATDTYEWTPQAISVFGFEADEVPKNLNEFLQYVHHDDIEALYKEMEVADATSIFDLEHRVIIKGMVKWVRFMSFLERDENGQPTNSIGVIKDITERKLVEEELVGYRQRLEELVHDRTIQLESTIKDLEAFAYSISHDLRGPLRHINGFAKMLDRSLPDKSTKVQNYLELISDSSRRMGIMIDGLLNLSRLGQHVLQKSKVQLNKLCTEVIRNFKPDLESRNIVWTIGHLPPINADEALMKIVLENLIGNAIKYTRNCATAHIEIQAGKATNPPCTFYIKDNGAGFNMAYGEKLFGVFQRLHDNEEFEGNGIGLASAKQIIEKHGGSIRAIGDVGNGATFFVTI